MFDEPANPNGFILYYKIQVWNGEAARNHCCLARNYQSYGGSQQKYCPLQNDFVPGLYYVSVIPVSLASDGIGSEKVEMLIPQYQVNQNAIIIGVVMAFLTAVVMIIVAVTLHQK